MNDDFLVAIFNGCEALLWMALAGFVAGRYRNTESPARRLSQIASVLLLLFSVSDVIEIWTGAWWRPVWLLALNAICLCGLLGCGRRAIRLGKDQVRPDKGK